MANREPDAERLVKMDGRGRVTIASLIRKNGVEPSSLWELSFGQFGAVTLTPVVVTAVGAAA